MTPLREWWTPDALAEAGLPDLPTTKRRINAMADREGWRLRTGKARERAGRGGGWEYHWSLLPTRAQKALLVGTQAVDPAPVKLDRVDAWRIFEDLPETARAKARDRLEVLQKFETFAQAIGRDQAAREMARSFAVSARTIWNWLALVEGVDPADWLAYLAPRHRTGARRTAGGGIGDFSGFFDLLKADYLRLEAPSFAASYEVACRIARAKGLPILAERTARRRIDDIPRVTRVFAREGERGLAKCFPPQVRDRTQMVAMEGVNADCHKFDVFVQWDDDDKPRRAQLVAFQDLYSGKILSWRIDRDPNKVAVMSAFGELVETWGIPRHCLFDNGMEFANKWLSGGTSTRFKVRDDDPLGVLPQLGIQIHWAKPAHGQAKPVERAFRDMAQRIAKDARFAGAYVGNRPDAKPENYMSRAIPLAEFVAVVADGIEQHNARVGRQSPTCRGRSFDETFAESYAVAPIRKAMPEQRRLWLMGQEVLKAHATHGRVTMHKATYWSDWMTDIAGEKVICRFDPEDLNAGLEIYALDGSYLGFAATQEKTEFFNLAAAQEAAALDRRRKRLAKAALDAERPVDAAQVAAELKVLVRDAVTSPESRVVELVQQSRGPVINRTLPRPDEREDDAAHEAAMILKFRAPEPISEVPDDEAGRWRRAKEIEARLAAEAPVGSAEAQWLYGYQQTSEYRTHERMAERFGPDAIG